MNAGKLETSDRLQKLFTAIKDRKWHSTYELMLKTRLCAVGSAISELRRNDIIIDCRCVGQGKYEYKYMGKENKRRIK